MEKKNTKLRSFFTIIDKIFDFLITFILFALFAIVIVQIVGRIIGKPVSWTEEASRFLFIWMMFIGLAVSFRRAESSRVTVFLDMMPDSFKRYSKYLYTVVNIGFFIFMFFTGVFLVKQQIAMNELGAAILMPMWLVGLCVPTSAILGIISSIQCFIDAPELIDGRK